MDIIQERALPIISALGNNFRVRAIDNSGHSISIPIAQFFQERYRGVAYTTTNPGISQIGDWYHCGETGTFTNFNNQIASEFDRFYFNGITWDLVPFSQIFGIDYSYVSFQNQDPTEEPPPSSGYYKVGVYNGSMWILDSTGAISYVGGDIASQEFTATSDGQTDFIMTRDIGVNSMVFHNGSVLPGSEWSTVGTTLSLRAPAYEGDKIIVIF